MTDKKKRTVNRYVKSDIDIAVTVDELLLYLNDLKAKNPDETLYVEKNYGYGDSIEIDIMGSRLETDEELATRLQKEAAALVQNRVNQQANELKEYKRLKKKFEGK